MTSLFPEPSDVVFQSLWDQIGNEPEPEPWDPMCQKYAKDMEYLDGYWATSQDELDAVPEADRGPRRAEYIRAEEGTYNYQNGHFLCDECYIAAGMPSGRNGWTCP